LKIQEIKKRLREKATSLRGEISNEVAAEAADTIAARFFKTWSPGRSKVIGVFWPIKSEINIRPLIDRLYQAGCSIVLPEVVAPSKVLFIQKMDAPS
jgi:5-formyltetrahydrofolate cyclo-ligase